jgi:hypothetical protein
VIGPISDRSRTDLAASARERLLIGEGTGRLLAAVEDISRVDVDDEAGSGGARPPTPSGLRTRW